MQGILEGLGYQCLLSEQGTMGLLDGESLESECAESVKKSDILISLIGGRLGTMIEKHGRTLSQIERDCARENGIPTITFVSSKVLESYNLFVSNDRRVDINYTGVEDVRVFHLFEAVTRETPQSPRYVFSGLENLSDLIKAQLIGLHSRMYQRLRSERVGNLLDKQSSNIPRAITNVEMDYFKSVNHPAILSIIKQLGFGFRLVFRRRSEFLEAAYALGFYHFDTVDGTFVIRLDEELRFRDGIGRHVALWNNESDGFKENRDVIASELEKRPEFAKKLYTRKSGYFVVGYIPREVFSGGDFLVSSEEFRQQKLRLNFFAFHVKHMKDQK